MRTSETIKEIAASLAKAQAAMTGAAKDAKNPAFKSTYATLASVIEAARGPLTENGIAYIQAPSLDEHGLSVTTTLLHSSGEWISNVLTLPLIKRDAHGIGSATTYACRYSLMALLGLPPVDDDGNAAIGEDPSRRRAVQVERAKEPDHQLNELSGVDAPKSSAQAKRDGDWPALKASIGNCTSSEAVLAWWTEENKATLRALKPTWRDEAIEEWRQTLLNQICQDCTTASEVDRWWIRHRKEIDALNAWIQSLVLEATNEAKRLFEKVTPLEAAE